MLYVRALDMVPLAKASLRAVCVCAFSVCNKLSDHPAAQAIAMLFATLTCVDRRFQSRKVRFFACCGLANGPLMCDACVFCALFLFRCNCANNVWLFNFSLWCLHSKRSNGITRIRKFGETNTRHPYCSSSKHCRRHCNRGIRAGGSGHFPEEN